MQKNLKKKKGNQMSNSEDMLKVMLQARTELVMTYLDYIELLSKQLLSRTNTSKTARDCSFDERDREVMKAKLCKMVEVYSHYYCRFHEVSEALEREMTRRVMQDMYPPVLPVVLQAPKRDLYPSKPDWLNDVQV